jgi:imidazolonepropionase-like amidohydrolase
MDALICAEWLLTGPSGQRLTDGAVFVEGDRISAVGLRAVLQARTGDQLPVLEYPGSTLLPGLINSNVHLCFDTRADPVRAFRDSSPEQLLSGVADRAAQALQAGVTTIRDLAGIDAGLPGAVFDNFAGTLELYSWLGFANDRIIEFATVNAAATLGLGAVTGRLAPGLAADLLVVEGDPLTTLDALHNVRMVGGTLHPPGSAAPRI